MPRDGQPLLVAALLGALCCQLPFVSSAHAQASVKGSITGAVEDVKGGVIPNVLVMATSRLTRALRSAKTDASGNYAIQLLDPGIYELRAEVQGFKVEVRPSIEVTTQAPSVVNFTMQLGAVTEQVTVEAREEVLGTTQTSVSGLVTPQQIEQLPQQTRTFIGLVALQPGVVDAAMAGPQYSGTGEGGFVHGQRLDTNTFTIDGINVNDPGFPGNTLLATRPLPLESIQEFRVQLSNPDANFGTSSGAQISITTKGGGNEPHGSVFYYHRNDATDARNPFNPTGKTEPLKQHQFGFSLGGPIIKDKTFYFGTYEGLIQRRGAIISGVVPTPLLYSMIPDGPSFGNLSSVLKVSYGLLPNTIVPGALTGVATFARAIGTRSDSFLVRVDHTFNSRDKIFARFYLTDNTIDLIEADLPSGTSDVQQTKNQRNSVVSYDHVFSATVLNNFRIGFFRALTDFPPLNKIPELNALGFNGDNLQARDSLPFIFFAGTNLTLLGQIPIFPFTRPLTTVQGDDDLSITRGNHQIRIGAGFWYLRLNETISPNFRPFVVFLGLTGGPGSLTSGVYLSAQQNIPVKPDTFLRGYRQTNWYFYGSDVYRATRKLTFNFGLRWEYFGIPSERNGFLHNVYQADSTGKPIEDAPITNVRNIVIAQAGDCSGCLRFFKRTLTNFEPRIGAAYLLLPKIVLRAGYSLMFNPPYYEEFNAVRANQPETASSTLLMQPFGTFPTPMFGPGQSITGANPSFRPNYTQSWSLALQQQTTADSSFTIRYVGARGVKLAQILSPNGGANLALASRPNPSFGVFDYLSTTAFSNYHGLEIDFVHRLSRGLYLQTNYTWSKSLDTASVSHVVFGRDPIVPTNDANTRADYGRSDFDTRHLFRANFNYELPFGRGKRWGRTQNPFLMHLISGWVISDITEVRSGLPFSIFSGVDSNGDGTINDRAVFLKGSPTELLNPNRHGTDKTQWLAPLTCAGVPLVCSSATGVQLTGDYSLGPPSGRNILSGPRLVNFNISLGKVFSIRERAKVQFRTEFYNAFNHTNLQIPFGTTNIGAGTFGQILLTSTPAREIQFSLRISF